MNITKPRDKLKLISDNKIVEHYSGSIAYGTNLPSSDIDIRGIFIADPINIRTPFFTIKEGSIETEEDTKFYELTQFLKLTLDNNPNIIESLWIDESDIIFKDSLGCYDLLRSHRKDFLCSKVAFTYTGYAYSQLKRIKGHKKWINNPQSENPPKQIDFITLIQNFTEDKILKFSLEDYQVDYRLIPYVNDIYGVYKSKGNTPFSYDYSLNTTFEGDRLDFKNPLFIIKFNKEEYNQKLDYWKNYWKWKNNRNEVRSELEEKYGYDTKHCMHLTRLLRTGLEILKTGEVLVKRPDSKELLEIRNGSMSYDEIIEYADYMNNEIKIWYTKTSLPEKPNLHIAANLLIHLQDMMWQK